MIAMALVASVLVTVSNAAALDEQPREKRQILGHLLGHLLGGGGNQHHHHGTQNNYYIIITYTKQQQT